jgi:hypothetical protein
VKISLSVFFFLNFLFAGSNFWTPLNQALPSELPKSQALAAVDGCPGGGRIVCHPAKTSLSAPTAAFLPVSGQQPVIPPGKKKFLV